MTDEAELVARLPNDVSRCLPATECPRAMTCARFVGRPENREGGRMALSAFDPDGYEAYIAAGDEPEDGSLA